MDIKLETIDGTELFQKCLFIFMCFKDRIREREEEETEKTSSALLLCSSLQMPTQPGLSHAKNRRLEVQLGLSYGWQGPSI